MKRRIGRLGWWIAGGAASLLALGAGYYLYAFELYHPLSANFDPLVQSVKEAEGSPWYGHADMRACCFEPGRQRSDVLAALAASEFKQSEASGWEETFFGKEYLSAGRMVFSRTATRFPCMDDFFIAVAFDEADKLKTSEGTWINAACL